MAKERVFKDKGSQRRSKLRAASERSPGAP